MNKLTDAQEKNDSEQALLVKRAQADTFLKRLTVHEQFFKKFSSEANSANTSILNINQLIYCKLDYQALEEMNNKLLEDKEKVFSI